MNRLTSEQCGGRSDASDNVRVGDQVSPDCGAIEVQLRDVGQLFDALDPSPFHDRDLNGDAEEYIVESVKELPSKATYELVAHLDQ